jgi:hypothetical protein
MIEYQLYYQPEGTVVKNFTFNKDDDFRAMKHAKDYCKSCGAKLIALYKITYKKLEVY